MICPHDQSQCFLRRCERGCYDQPTPPPPPTLAEMMRLMIDLEDAAHDAAVYPNIPQCAASLLQTRATLMAAIRAYGRE